MCADHGTEYWRGPNYRKEFAVYRLFYPVQSTHMIEDEQYREIDYFVTKTQENTEKNTRRFKVNSSSIRQYSFGLT